MQTYYLMLLQVINNEKSILASIVALNDSNFELKNHFKPILTHPKMGTHEIFRTIFFCFHCHGYPYLTITVHKRDLKSHLLRYVWHESSLKLSFWIRHNNIVIFLVFLSPFPEKKLPVHKKILYAYHFFIENMKKYILFMILDIKKAIISSLV